MRGKYKCHPASSISLSQLFRIEDLQMRDICIYTYIEVFCYHLEVKPGCVNQVLTCSFPKYLVSSAPTLPSPTVTSSEIQMGLIRPASSPLDALLQEMKVGDQLCNYQDMYHVNIQVLVPGYFIHKTQDISALQRELYIEKV